MRKHFKSLKFAVLTIAGVFILGLCTSCDDDVREYLVKGYLYESPDDETPVSNATLSFVMSAKDKEIGTAKTDKRGRFAFRFQNEGYFRVPDSFVEDRCATADVDIDIYYRNNLIATYNTYDDGGRTMKIYVNSGTGSHTGNK